MPDVRFDSSESVVEVKLCVSIITGLLKLLEKNAPGIGYTLVSDYFVTPGVTLFILTNFMTLSEPLFIIKFHTVDNKKVSYLAVCYNNYTYYYEYLYLVFNREIREALELISSTSSSVRRSVFVAKSFVNELYESLYNQIINFHKE